MPRSNTTIPWLDIQNLSEMADDGTFTELIKMADWQMMALSDFYLLYKLCLNLVAYVGVDNVAT